MVAGWSRSLMSGLRKPMLVEFFNSVFVSGRNAGNGWSFLPAVWVLPMPLERLADWRKKSW